VLYISFDAHLDFYDEWNGNKEAHCTITKRIFDLEYMNDDSVFVIGARDIDLLEISLSKKNELKYTTMLEYSKSSLPFVKFIQNFFSKGLKDSTDEKSKRKAYISIDIDVLDPSVAPATGYPIPGGLQYRELIFGIEYLSKIFNVVGLDLVEYAPNLDMKNLMTGFLGAKLISESMAHIKINK
jgi:agmatinase